DRPRGGATAPARSPGPGGVSPPSPAPARAAKKKPAATTSAAILRDICSLLSYYRRRDLDRVPTVRDTRGGKEYSGLHSMNCPRQVRFRETVWRHLYGGKHSVRIPRMRDTCS